MGRYKTYREPRRRGFDDDNYSPPDRGRGPRPAQFQRASAETSPVTEATVAWFNPEKGFGFVKTDDGSDAFLHIRPLEAAGHKSAPPGARLKVRLRPGQKGPQVAEVLEVQLSTAELAKPARTSRRPFLEGGAAMEEEGIVKWFSAEKGFGFVSPSSGGKDVFVHASALASSGLVSLNEGQQVTIRFVVGKKGPEATSIQAKG
jgi:cold shock protein